MTNPLRPPHAADVPPSVETPDSTELADIQALNDTRGVALKTAGVRGVVMPMRLLEKSGGVQAVSATIAMGVDLPEADKGTHMSRFIIQLAEWSRERILSLNLHELLDETRGLLNARQASLDMQFAYAIEKAAPVTGLKAPMTYRCSFRARATDTTYTMTLGITVPIATLCPCSKAISDYGAHNQRADIRVEVMIDTKTDHRMVWLEDLVTLLEACGSCPVYPVLKRADEKYVTERQYDNPKFVEDVAREAILALRDMAGITGFSIEVEALESIHGHNAWAAHTENFRAL